jgi:hypothetical protein
MATHPNNLCSPAENQPVAETPRKTQDPPHR